MTVRELKEAFAGVPDDNEVTAQAVLSLNTGDLHANFKIVSASTRYHLAPEANSFVLDLEWDI